MRVLRENRNIVVFVAITLSCSLVLWGSLAIFQIEAPNLESSEPTKFLPMFLFVLNGFIPSIAGVILYRRYHDVYKGRLKSIIPSKDLVVPTIVLIGSFGVIIILQVFMYNLFIAPYDDSVIGANIAQLIPLIILGPLSEEIGWRGYLQDQFKSKNSLKVSFFIGVVWALWHLPLFLIPGTTQQINHVNFFTFLILLVLQSYIMTYFYNRYQGSLFISIFIHYLYTVIVSFYLLGTSYSLLSDIVSIVPVVLFALTLFLLERNQKNKVQCQE
jgi:membrane protease YdiL (CAAX protease family)